MLHEVWYSLVPLCINYKAKEKEYQKEFSQIPEHDLPAIILTFNKTKINPQPHGIYERFISTLAGNLFNGVIAFVNHKSSQPFKKV